MTVKQSLNAKMYRVFGIVFLVFPLNSVRVLDSIGIYIFRDRNFIAP